MTFPTYITTKQINGLIEMLFQYEDVYKHRIYFDLLDNKIRIHCKSSINENYMRITYYTLDVDPFN